jgi:ribosome-associated protein
VYKAGESPAWKVEGRSNGQWILMDYVNVVAHIFLSDKREYYGLEDLWGDAKTTRIS